VVWPSQLLLPSLCVARVVVHYLAFIPFSSNGKRCAVLPNRHRLYERRASETEHDKA
jgi:hypothetical protein